VKAKNGNLIFFIGTPLENVLQFQSGKQDITSQKSFGT
jgi:hypothetical protein